ncbi:hypothetical protein [Streptomyces sp. A30]|uniref:hypothetical protein n=1 Tax=Streptomyces sp. A30 TaxID=2789273 RepID=UPI0039818728
MPALPAGPVLRRGRVTRGGAGLRSIVPPRDFWLTGHRDAPGPICPRCRPDRS